MTAIKPVLVNPPHARRCLCWGRAASAAPAAGAHRRAQPGQAHAAIAETTSARQLVRDEPLTAPEN
jgi:hypothetical protein